MSAIATTVVRQSVRLFVSAAIVHTALDVLQAAWQRVHKADPTTS